MFCPAGVNISNLDQTSSQYHALEWQPEVAFLVPSSILFLKESNNSSVTIFIVFRSGSQQASIPGNGNFIATVARVFKLIKRSYMFPVKKNSSLPIVPGEERLNQQQEEK
eukprot:scaffold4086_cov65-Cylindrotheca_fusiformis.AAC.1